MQIHISLFLVDYSDSDDDGDADDDNKRGDDGYNDN